MFRKEYSILVFTCLNAYILSVLKLRSFQVNKVNVCTYMSMYLKLAFLVFGKKKLAFLYDKKAIKVYNTISFAWVI